MAKSKKVSRKLRHKRDVAQKRRARAFYRMREQDREIIDEAMSKGSVWPVYALTAGLAGRVALGWGVLRVVKTIINMWKRR